MARAPAPDRFDALIRAATAVFIERGYRRTQMSDVAERAGCAKGTVYLYFESKEALFEQALLASDQPGIVRPPKTLPIATPPRGSTRRKLRARIARDARLPILEQAAARPGELDLRSEIAEITRALHVLLSTHRVAIKLLDRCVRDFPELSAVWSREGRGGVVTLLERYLRDRTRRGAIQPLADPAVTARIVLEVVVHWAVHRHWDPLPDPRFDDEALVEQSVVDFVVRALCGAAS